MNAIVGFSEILAATEEEKEKQEYVSIIENNNALLLQLIGDILDLSKIEAGTMEFIYTDFELNKLMEELENSLRLKLDPGKDVVLTFEAGSSECCIHTDRNRLSQLIINLVTNAIKFTDRGSIRFGYELLETRELYFYVIDTGCGIPGGETEKYLWPFRKTKQFCSRYGAWAFDLPNVGSAYGGKNRGRIKIGRRIEFLVYSSLYSSYRKNAAGRENRAASSGEENTDDFSG